MVNNRASNNCVHTDGDTAAATPRSASASVPVRAPPACGNSSGQRQLVTVDVEPAVDWRLDPPCRSSAGGVDARLLCTLNSPRRQRKSKAYPPCPSAIASSLSLPPNPPIPFERVGPLRSIPSRLADPPAAGGRLHRLQCSTAVGEPSFRAGSFSRR